MASQETREDLVNATMSELSIMLLFVFGLAFAVSTFAYTGGHLPPCFMDKDGQPRGLIRLTLTDDGVEWRFNGTTKNLNDYSAHFPKDELQVKKFRRFTFGETADTIGKQEMITDLLASLEAARKLFASQRNSMGPCRIATEYRIQISLPNRAKSGPITHEVMGEFKLIRTKFLFLGALAKISEASNADFLEALQNHLIANSDMYLDSSLLKFEKSNANTDNDNDNYLTLLNTGFAPYQPIN